ncbi:hypothetical protein EON62_04935 [archaeon]|nr:MAG: hypothetical protein EON62_04935 [archaeon]
MALNTNDIVGKLREAEVPPLIAAIGALTLVDKTAAWIAAFVRIIAFTATNLMCAYIFSRSTFRRGNASCWRGLDVLLCITYVLPMNRAAGTGVAAQACPPRSYARLPLHARPLFRVPCLQRCLGLVHHFDRTQRAARGHAGTLPVRRLCVHDLVHRSTRTPRTCLSALLQACPHARDASALPRLQC